jgi:DNA-binding HxlR family transcriptional regulator
MAAEKEKKSSKAGQFAYEGLDRIMHEKARLGILTSLASHTDGLLFNDLKELCSLTDGNLSRHLQTLQEAGLIELWKGYSNKRPQTLCRLSEKGRGRFLEYLAELEKVVQDAAAIRDNEKENTAAMDDGPAEGWQLA